MGDTLKDIERLADINDHLRRQLDKSNEIILELNHMVAKHAGEIAMLRAEKQGVRIVKAEEWAQIAEHNAEIANLEKWRDALMKQTAEQIAEIAALRAQVAELAELEAWKAAVPVAEIVRYTFDQYDSTTIRPSADWHKIKDWMDVVSPE